MLNNRLQAILQELLSTNSPVTGSYLANKNNVTPRTTRADMKQLNAILEKSGSRITSERGKGYLLKVEDENLFHRLLEKVTIDSKPENMIIPNTHDERIAFMIKRMLVADGFIKLDDLADELFVSKSTVQNDLKQVKDILAAYEISIQSKPNYGLQAVGNEMKLRFCLAEYLIAPHSDRDNHNFIAQMYEFRKNDLQHISAIILKQIKLHHIVLSDIAINNLLIHIAIALQRIKNGYHVKLSNADIASITRQKEFKVAKEIVNTIEEKFEIQFPSLEVVYVAIHLLGTKLLTKTNYSERLIMDGEISHLVELALNSIEAELNLGIKNDKELIIGLGLHLKPAINRYKYDMNIRNPMLVNIKRNYPLAFEAGILAGFAIKDETGIDMDENEIGYLALHIGAAIERRKFAAGPKRCIIVCASGLGTAQLIFYKLRNYFGKNLDIAGITEYYQLMECDLDDIDFIVSSIPIEQDIHVPVVKVNAVLESNDLQKVEQVLTGQQHMAKHYLNEDLLFLQQSFDSKEAVLQYLQDVLLDMGLVDSSLLQAIYEREKFAPTSFGNLVAVPHPITPKSRETFLAFCTLKKPIMWNERPVQFICLLCVKKDSMEDLQSMYNLLGKIIDTTEIVQQLVKAKTTGEFNRILAGVKVNGKLYP